MVTDHDISILRVLARYQRAVEIGHLCVLLDEHRSSVSAYLGSLKRAGLIVRTVAGVRITTLGKRALREAK